MRESAANPTSRRRTARWRAWAPWLALVALLVVPPLASALASPRGVPQGWLLASLAQAATMIVFALSYNLLLGETGLLSFGHAAPAGLGALFAAHLFNRYAIALPLLPLAGGLGGAAFGALTALVAARRAGTAFAMITLGLGELVAAAAWALPGWFGGEAGVGIDRASGPAWADWSFGPDRQAYCVIAAWCIVAVAAMFAFSRTPFARLANAVRDNPVRAAALGIAPARARAVMIVWSAGFAGVAGTLALINIELAAAESVGMMRSAAVLIATVTGGAASFFGPVLGALVWVVFSVGVAGVTREALEIELKGCVPASFEVLGRVGWEDSLAAVGACDYSVLLRDPTNRRSAFGMPSKVAESLLLGTPVFGNAIGDLARYLSPHENAELVDSTDFAEVEAMLSRIVAGHTRLDRAQVRALGERYFRPEHYATSLDRLLYETSGTK